MPLEMDRTAELYGIIRSRRGEALPGFEETVALSCYDRAIRLAKYLTLRADRMYEACYMCDKTARKSIVSEVYDSPFDNASKDLHFCSEECQDKVNDSYYTDFNYLLCDGCFRLVCARNPRNGWHEHFRVMNDCEMYCLKCYEGIILENGIDRESFAEGKINGMFFSRGNVEAIDAGYSPVIGYDGFYVANIKAANKYCTKALTLIDKGYKVITGYERMAIGGLEGTVTLLAKRG